MRYLPRLPLPKKAAVYFVRRQTRANQQKAAGTLDVNKAWKEAGPVSIKAARDTLKTMAGARHRCMYCSDSAGTDIDHFWPKARFHGRMFQWLNMVLCCSGCGALKSSRFPRVNGKPLLLDPTVDDPWRFLEYSPNYGQLVPLATPRFKVHAKRAEKTVEVMRLDEREALETGYKKSYRRIMRTLDAALVDPAPVAATLIADLRDDDDHGLLGWIFRGTGANEPRVLQMKQVHPAVWQACEQALRNS
jgi:uncharacterized protein (TIGR02646 family)